MTQTKKMAALLQTDTATQTSPDSTGPELKWRRVLRALIEGSLNRFQAEGHPVRDHCLNSTVAELRHDMGIVIADTWETVPCHGGTATQRVKRYRVARDPDSLRRARELLGQT